MNDCTSSHLVYRKSFTNVTTHNCSTANFRDCEVQQSLLSTLFQDPSLTLDCAGAHVTFIENEGGIAESQETPTSVNAHVRCILCECYIRHQCQCWMVPSANSTLQPSPQRCSQPELRPQPASSCSGALALRALLHHVEMLSRGSSLIRQ